MSVSKLNQELTERIEHLIHEYPAFGYRRIWAILRFREGLKVNRKTVYRIMYLKGWMLHHRKATPRPRVQAWKSSATKSNERWATDMTHVYCGQDGWAHLSAVIDCCDRECIGFEFSLRGRAREAEMALEDACLTRFGTLQKTGPRPSLRSDNGMIFLAKSFRKTCKEYGISQEFITPYTPQQNGMVERFFRSVKEECVWIHNFESFAEAKKAISEWIRWYNNERPHQSLNYMSPVQFRAQQLKNVA